ncbi:unnamed protein product [Onchocerca flexuosa]|uniref:CMP/dCMP-type deaminase domain-containing protein n=1 Tax=Onchocerca flexuosa TaxID=387005 RepID=A0A183HYH8_9BILA|nr:unnamed protein product [Onchocerca flexuosa]
MLLLLIRSDRCFQLFAQQWTALSKFYVLFGALTRKDQCLEEDTKQKLRSPSIIRFVEGYCYEMPLYPTLEDLLIDQYQHQKNYSSICNCSYQIPVYVVMNQGFIIAGEYRLFGETSLGNDGADDPQSYACTAAIMKAVQYGNYSGNDSPPVRSHAEPSAPLYESNSSTCE